MSSLYKEKDSKSPLPPVYFDAFQRLILIPPSFCSVFPISGNDTSCSRQKPGVNLESTSRDPQIQASWDFVIYVQKTHGIPSLLSNSSWQTPSLAAYPSPSWLSFSALTSPLAPLQPPPRRHFPQSSASWSSLKGHPIISVWSLKPSSGFWLYLEWNPNSWIASLPTSPTSLPSGSSPHPHSPPTAH